jgi:hypothetical protein
MAWSNFGKSGGSKLQEASAVCPWAQADVKSAPQSTNMVITLTVIDTSV